jgi:hypothetical protein
MRADLVSVTGDGRDLSFSVVGTGDVVVDLAQAITPVVTGASVVSQTGTQLTLGLTGSGQQNVSIDLMSPPTISGTVANQAITDLQTITPFAGVTIADANLNQTETVTITLSAAANGTLSNLGIFTNPSAGVYTATGSASAVTAALDALVFTPTANQVAPGQTVTTGFSITDTDTAALTATDTITSVIATDVGVSPTITGTAANQAITDLQTIAPFSGVTIADVNVGQTETVTVTLSAAVNGALSNLGIFTNPSAGVYTATGSASAVTAALDALVFTPTANQVAPGQAVTTGFTITDTDTAALTATDTITSVIATDVAVSPTISGTKANQAITDLQTIAPFSGVTIADVNVGQTETVTVTLSAAANGTLSNLGIFTNPSADVYTATGSASAMTAALDALVFTPTANQVAPGQTVTTDFTITDTDTAALTATDTITSVIATDVGVSPTISGTKAGQAITDLQTITPFSGVTIGDANIGQTETLTVTLSAAANGTLTDPNAATDGSTNVGGVYTITGSASAVTTALDALVFTPTENQVASGQSVTTTFTIADKDTGGLTATDSTTSVVATEVIGQTFTLTTGKDTVGSSVNTIIAKTNTLSSGDTITPAPNSTLELVGGGTFNLALPTTLTNIEFITAQEGEGATAQTVTLRAGLNATVNVASDTTATDTSPTITITGAANSDIINLGSGNDTVTLGAGETVNSGGGNNTFKVASATLGSVTINGGTKGTNTLDVTGGGTATMGAGITGITTVDLANATTFTANATPGLQVIGTTGADHITAGGAGQVLSGGAGGSTLTGANAGDDIFRDTAANTNNATIVNLLPSDVIDITNLAPATTTLTKSVVSATSTTLTLTSGATNTKITLSGSYQGNFVLGADTTGGGGTDITFVPTTGGTVIDLPTTPVTLNTGPVSTTIVATAASLLAADSITGGTGTGVVNTLVLSGGGAFNLAALAQLTNFEVIDAQEGEGATAQTVTLRAGLKNATVNVAADTSGDSSPGITIIGANDSDVINLGPGADTVTLGNDETVNGGAGTDIYNVTKTTIANTTIKGGSGSNTLVVTGGGNATMGANITGMKAVQLATTTNFTANSTAGLQISGSSAGGDTITLGAATQSVVAGGPNETVKVSAANAGASVSGLGANSTLDITSGGTITLNANTDVTTVKLTSASTLILNGMAFITADGSTGKDTIQAGGIDQTLTGGGGADTLIGFSGGYDTFRDTAANLNGDTINDFINTDKIDLTNMLYSTAETVTAVAKGANTSVTVTSGATKSVFTIAGSWSSSGFHLASDGASGTFLTHT